MNFLIEWFARHRIAANLLVVATIICAFLATRELPREIIPRLTPDNLTISTALPGAGPSITETLLCIPIENALASLPAIEHIRSSSLSNQCIINIELRSSADAKKSRDEISSAVQQLPLPPEATRPVIASSLKDAMVMRLSLSGTADYRILHDTAKMVVSDLKALGISKASVIETRSRQHAVEVSLAQLQQYQISMAEIANTLRQNAINLPAGHVSSDNGITSVVVSGEYNNVSDLANSVIRSLPDGSLLRLGDIATIRDEFSGLENRVNGEPSVAISIYQGSNKNMLDISRKVHEYIAKTQPGLPANVKLLPVFDNAQFFSARMDYLQGNFISGLVISSLILLLWLRLRLAFWITADIPIAFGGGLIWLYLMGGSLNIVSAFGLIIVLGIVCDDAIVIGENIYRHQCNGRPRLAGAISGTREVAKTVIFAVSTTVLMFLPLLFMPGSEGQLMKPLPMIIIAILIASLIEALLVLPTHLAHYAEKKSAPAIGYAIAEKMDAAALRFYRPLLSTAVKWRYSVFVFCFALFIISISLMLSGTMKVNFFSAIETEIATGAVSFPAGTDAQKTLAAARTMEQAALALKKELDEEFGIDQIRLVRTFVANKATHGEVYLSLATASERKIDSHLIMQRWQQKTGEIAGATELTFNATIQVNPSNFNIQLHGNDLATLANATAALKQQLQNYPGVSHIRDTLSPGHEEIRLQLKPAAFDMGLNTKTVSTQIHMALEGIPLQKLDGNNVTLQLPEAERRSFAQLQNLPIQTSPLNTIPLSAIADIHLENSPVSILHIDGRRVAQVSAEIDGESMTNRILMDSLTTDFLQHLETKFPGIGWSKTGALEAESTLKNYLATSFMLSLLAMFIMLAVFLNSWFQPLMIFTAIPFGIVGALFGHLAFGQELTLWSLAGMIAVSGIVVNNNMVIIFFINERGKAGESITDTIIMAGADRFRPIMLTTVTTFVGVLPTIINNSWEAQFLTPLAISIGCGVLFAALLTLFLVPCLYLIAEDIKAWQTKTVKSLPAGK